MRAREQAASSSSHLVSQFTLRNEYGVEHMQIPPSCRRGSGTLGCGNVYAKITDLSQFLIAEQDHIASHTHLRADCRRMAFLLILLFPLFFLSSVDGRYAPASYFKFILKLCWEATTAHSNTEMRSLLPFTLRRFVF